MLTVISRHDRIPGATLQTRFRQLTPQSAIMFNLLISVMAALHARVDEQVCRDNQSRS